MIEFITTQLRNYRLELFEKLNKQYCIKFIFTGYREKKEFDGMGIPKSWNYEKINDPKLLSKLLSKKNLINWVSMTRALLRDNYELILSSPAENDYSLLALVIAKLRFKKIIFWGESWHWQSNNIILKLYRYILIKWMLRQGDAIIAMGAKQYAFYVKTLKKKTGIFYAPKYVVPYKKRDATQLVESLALEDRKILGKKIILYMSQVEKRKGLDYLIRAFGLLEVTFDNIYLLIVGSGPFEAYCKKLAKELGVTNIMFKGYISDSDVELYHNVCDVLVLPSIFLDDYPEPNGYVLYESMSVGKPLVVTDAVGAVPELVRDGVNGFVVKDRNIIELADALSKILSDERLRKKMGNKSKEIFDEKISLDGQVEAFKTAIDFVRRQITE
jgi:glycosyltransferase involved in cell wall biosynthesis